jgi:hypothetical protein
MQLAHSGNAPYRLAGKFRLHRAQDASTMKLLLARLFVAFPAGLGGDDARKESAGKPRW